MFEFWAYVSVIASNISWKLESKLLEVMKVFQNNLFLSWDISVNITYFYAKMQSNIFVAHFCKFS